MEQRRRLAAVKVALIKSSKEECALGTEQRRRLEGCTNASKQGGVCIRHIQQ